MEQIERALRKSRESRQSTIRLRNGATARLKAPPPLEQMKTKAISLAPTVLRNNRIINAEVYHPVTDVYRSLRAQVLKALTSRRKTTIGITSANRGEGKTLTAVNLAVAMAMDVNHTVLLVDADLRNPGVAQCLGLQPELGLSDYLTGDTGISDCLIHPKIDRLFILPGRSRIGNSAELLSSPQMLHLASELKARYADRLVIYDLPPILSIGDTIGFLPALDATLLVVRDGVTRATDLTRALEILSGYNLIGTVLNSAR